MALRANVNCKIRNVIDVDIHGKEVLGNGFPAKCAVVKLNAVSERTSVRTDSSASRGFGREIVADARLLFPTSTRVEIDDKVEIAGIKLTVLSKSPRFDVSGKIDHMQLDLMVWA